MPTCQRSRELFNFLVQGSNSPNYSILMTWTQIVSFDTKSHNKNSLSYLNFMRSKFSLYAVLLCHGRPLILKLLQGNLADIATILFMTIFIQIPSILKFDPCTKNKQKITWPFDIFLLQNYKSYLIFPLRLLIEDLSIIQSWPSLFIYKI